MAERDDGSGRVEIGVVVRRIQDGRAAAWRACSAWPTPCRLDRGRRRGLPGQPAACRPNRRAVPRAGGSTARLHRAGSVLGGGQPERLCSSSASRPARGRSRHVVGRRPAERDGRGQRPGASRGGESPARYASAPPPGFVATGTQRPAATHGSDLPRRQERSVYPGRARPWRDRTPCSAGRGQRPHRVRHGRPRRLVVERPASPIVVVSADGGLRDLAQICCRPWRGRRGQHTDRAGNGFVGRAPPGRPAGRPERRSPGARRDGGSRGEAATPGERGPDHPRCRGSRTGTAPERRGAEAVSVTSRPLRTGTRSGCLVGRRGFEARATSALCAGAIAWRGGELGVLLSRTICSVHPGFRGDHSARARVGTRVRIRAPMGTRPRGLEQGCTRRPSSSRCPRPAAPPSSPGLSRSSARGSRVVIDAAAQWWAGVVVGARTAPGAGGGAQAELARELVRFADPCRQRRRPGVPDG